MREEPRTSDYFVTVDPRQPLAERIAAGGYDSANRYLTEQRFPVTRTGGGEPGERRLVLVHLDRTASTDDVVEALAAPGLRAGRIEELLALGAARPELQRAFPIVALGTVAPYPDNYRRIPFLWGSERVRHLDLRWDEHTWSRNVRFLAARTAGPDER